jgi:enoyl-CoA hydratase
MTDGVIVTRTGDILEITLDSPDRGNGMTDDQIVYLGDVLEREHASARMIVLRANGADFCMGRAHLGPRPTALPEALQLRRMHDIVFRVYGAVRHSKAPVVSVVKGRAYGFGCALASVCDITIAEENARFAINEMNNNIMPTMVMSSLVDRVPLKALMYMVWTAKEIDARHAMSIGAVSEVVPAGEADRTANALVDRFRSLPLPAVLAVKEYAHGANAIDIGKAVAFARSLHAMVNTSSDMRPPKKD